MRLLRFVGILPLFVIAIPTDAFCQPGRIIDSTARKMHWYALNKASTTLFVHFDKNIYTNRETAWFTAYILEDRNKSTANVLSIALLRNDDRSVLAQGKFLLNGGLSQGSLYIPDSLPTGDYSFMCYTDGFVNGKPTDIFVQPVTIKTVNDDSFVAKLSIPDSLVPGMDSLRVRLNAVANDGKAIENAEVTHFIGNRTGPFKSGIARTNKYGEYTISIPLKQIDATNHHFQAEIKHGREVQSFSLQLPVYQKRAFVRFYPEGGNLVEGLQSTVGWEVTSSQGSPLQVVGHLYKDDKQIGIIKTNESGVGRFTITPSTKNVYKVKIQAVDYARDSMYILPAAITGGPLLSIENALAADTLFISITNKQAGTKWLGLIHNYKSIFVSAEVKANGGEIRVKVPLTDLPKGLYTFTLLDSLQRPWAERMFFAHYDQKPVVSIATDRFYTTRQKVDVTLKVSDAQGSPLPVMVSIACVRDNRFDSRKMTDIESYRYLVHELSPFPIKKDKTISAEENKNGLEDLLLVRGWRKYKWQELAAVEAKDTLQIATKIVFAGRAYNPRKPSRYPLLLALMRAPHLINLGTDSSGNFTIPVPELIMQPGQYIRLVVKSDDQEKYIIHVTDFYKVWNQKLALAVPLSNFAPIPGGQSSQPALPDRKERVKALPDVKITARRHINLNGNVCGDYVCIANVLNCPRHPEGGTAPIVGTVYNTGRGKKLYEGCEGMLYLSKIDGIYTAKEFYVPHNPGSESGLTRDLASTIYWNHSLLTPASGETRFSFNTNDLTGKFRIVVQGVTRKAGVVYGEQFFEVKDTE